MTPLENYRMKLSPISIAAGTSLAASLFWGGWAFISNINAENVWATTGAQFLCTFCMTSLVTLTVSKLNSSMHGKIRRIVAPAAIASILATLVLLLVHYSVGTDNLLLTISAPSLLGFAFSLFYSYSLTKL